jgi:hypothetical protein
MYRIGQQFSARRDVTGEPVRYHHARRIPRASQQLLEEPSGSLLVSMRLHKDIENTAILVNGAPQVLQATVDLQV